MTAGMLLVAAQLLYFSRLGADASFWNLLPALLVGGVGHGADDDAERGRGDPQRARSTRRASARRSSTAPARSAGRWESRIMGAIMAARGGRPADSPRRSWTASSASLLVAAGIALAGAVVAFALVRPHEGAGERAGYRSRRTRR